MIPTQEDKIQFVKTLLENGLDAWDKQMFGESNENKQPKGHPSRPLVVEGRSIFHCYHECPYFQLEGGPSPMMVCGHPSLRGKGIEDCAIISHPDCDNGYPEKCPLIQEAV